MVGNTLVQKVFFSEIEVCDSGGEGEYVHTVDAQIPYNCGAFVSLIHYKADRIWYHRIRVIDGDGNWVGQNDLRGPTDLSTRIVFSQTDLFTPGSENGTEWENKFYWIRHWWIFYHASQARYESKEEWWGYNGHTGMYCGQPGDPVVRSDLYFGDYCPAWLGKDKRQWYYINCNDPTPEYVLDDGWYIPVYYVELGNPDPYYRGTMEAPTQIPSDTICISKKSVLDTDSRPEVFTFSFLPMMPNPATSSVTVRYSVGNPGNYEIKVYDLCGRVHAELLHGEVQAGVHSFTWDLSDDAGVNLPAGVYLVRLAGCDEEEIQRLVVLE